MNITFQQWQTFITLKSITKTCFFLALKGSVDYCKFWDLSIEFQIQAKTLFSTVWRILSASFIVIGNSYNYNLNANGLHSSVQQVEERYFFFFNYLYWIRNTSRKQA